jgi:hypothetical protein
MMTPVRSSQKALDLITTEETGGQVYYRTHYTHWDWPAGASGPTIGDGYDCGYVTPGEATRDWGDILTPDAVAVVVSACGIRGQAAHDWVRAHGDSVTVTWDQSVREFVEREVPKWDARVAACLPNLDALSGDSYGAILSLSYNRGTGGYDDPHPRFAEMRAIKAHMTARAFDLIPAEFLSMRRLWPQGGDLWRRRGHEADLFRAGLGQPSVSGQAPRPAVPPGPPADHSTRALQARLQAILEPFPPLATDGALGPRTRAAVLRFQQMAGLPADGVAGPATWTRMDDYPTAPQPAATGDTT